MDKTLLASFFSPDQAYVVAKAPGRLDVMGGIADYSGSLVLQKAIKETTTVAIALRHDGVVRIKSLTADKADLQTTFLYQDLLKNRQEVDYAIAREQVKKIQGGDWASYVVGCFLVLQKEKGIVVSGADILITSDVPVGKGVSSSAALEVATMKALKELYPLTFEPTELPRLAQKVENLIVGAPCGLMDQLASYFGNHSHLLPILCQPDIVHAPVAIPAGIYFVGIDSGIRHSVGDASYSDVRAAAYMGYSMIVREKGITNEQLAHAKTQRDFLQLPYQGYLANITPAEFEASYAQKLLYRMAGHYFIRHYPVHPDPVTTVEEEKFYAILDCTRHPVYENFRVKTFLLLLQYLATGLNQQSRIQCLEQLGELMYQSHTSYSICGLGNPHTDELVEMVKQNRNKGVYGAKITGGGSGGTVCVLCDGAEGLQTAHTIHQQYQEKHRKSVKFFE
ncbi:galactokinase family protein [Rhodocytophaga aerolata]|uniref:Galactokinase family protein n=1 Tax=Rhodocytophaga aerolata TaxID=455078 RepID=A0ABT8RCW9_9BACT|nr:galactokinase family protein [Rhodocytophaga aerolata]MDO1449078.1 galactokinase family protein [Rhodocytophaga aerolata]